MRWAYGVTTVPKRKNDLLPQTLKSLSNAGFDKPRLFVDGEACPCLWKKQFGLDVTARDDAVRTFGNWWLTMVELYLREPNAERYAIFQDDFVTYRNLRKYLEKTEYPVNGYWNLYTFPSNQELAPLDKSTGRVRVGWYLSNQFGRGAVALIFSREAVLTLLTQRHFVDRPMDCTRGHRAVDGGIVTAMSKAGWQEYVHNPSLVQHTGIYSSMGSKMHKQAISFRGESFDAMDLLK